MDNQQLLSIQLERLQKAGYNLETQADSQVIKRINQKRSDLVMRVFADLACQDRYRKAVRFLADDLLGGNQLSKRGNELMRAKKPMVKMLPDALLGTVARSVEFTAATLELECALAKYLQKEKYVANELTDTSYLAAVRAAIPREWLETQSALVVMIGEEIESVVHRPFIATALKMCRTPAYLMGLGDLQDFLERGFNAFRDMHGSSEFIALFSQREKTIIEQIYTTQSNPFPQ
ncbi:MAG: hypothetical protein JXA04_05170 [Gammaproteobacteria bacterium]|nr:hypothetical protein [Gammaproteobacteria bacterium]